MGVFYYVGAVALAEDIPDVELHGNDLKKFYADMDKGFQQVGLSIHLYKFGTYNTLCLIIFRMPSIAG